MFAHLQTANLTYALPRSLQTNHFVLAGLFDPSNVVTILLPDAVRHTGTDLLQDTGSNVVCCCEVLGITRRAHPTERPKAQRENITKTEAGRGESQTSFIHQVMNRQSITVLKKITMRDDVLKK